jgi:hypothetical protein
VFRFSDGSTETRAHFAIERMAEIAGPSKIGKFQVKQRAVSPAPPISSDIVETHWKLKIMGKLARAKEFYQ